MYSLLVKAFISPPTASIADEISKAVRLVVPLKSKCSRKCEAPATDGDSSREPTLAQIPNDALRTVVTSSVTIRRPLGRTVRRVVSDAIWLFFTWLFQIRQEQAQVRACLVDLLRRSLHQSCRQPSLHLQGFQCAFHHASCESARCGASHLYLGRE